MSQVSILPEFIQAASNAIAYDFPNTTMPDRMIIDYVANLVQPTTFILLAIVAILYILSKWPIWNRSQYPPGPLPLPFFGHSHWFYTSSNLYKYLYELRKKYGDVITLDVQKEKVVILNTAEAIYEGFVKNSTALSERPAYMHNPATGGYGLVHEKNGKWKDLRKHALGVFRQHGIGSKGIEAVIKEELKHFIHVIEGTKGRPIDLKEQLTQTVSNIITSVIFGDRFDYSAEQLANLQITEFRDVFEKTKYMPFMRHLPFDPSGYQAAKERHAAGLSFAYGQVAAHRKDIDYDNPRDYIDHYLVEIRKRAGDPGSPFTDLNLITSVMSLYLGGTDTTSSQLYWAFLYMVLYPDVQERIHQEIKDHIGERPVEYSDRNNMSYTMSVITELYRIGIAMGTLLHVATEDVVVRGQTIPKGTSVYANIWGPLHDPNVYEDPERFNPERFLDSNGRFAKPDPKYFTPFSAGKRVCLGQPLARTEVFLLLIGTLQRYEVQLGQNKVPSEQGKRWFVWIPSERYQVTFLPR